MQDHSSKYYLELPASFTAKYKNKKLIEILSDPIAWGMEDEAFSEKGRDKIIKANTILFDFIETLGDTDFYLEPIEGLLFELVPPDVNRQGIGFSVDTKRKCLELDLYMHPCDYSEDPSRDIPMGYILGAVHSFKNDTKEILRLIKKFFPGKQKSAVIPFSKDCIVTLNGNFMDHYPAVEKKCLKATADADLQASVNCRQFLHFVKHEGYSDKS